jgi:hypothetical protein
MQRNCLQGNKSEHCKVEQVKPSPFHPIKSQKETQMKLTNSQINKAFLTATDSKTKDSILTAIAKHYGISKEDAFSEIIDDEAEHLLDYLTGSIRDAAHVLMRRHGFGFAS